MMKTKIVHPDIMKHETYRVGFDDHCYVVSSGSDTKNERKVYLSVPMINWLYKQVEEKPKKTKKEVR